MSDDVPHDIAGALLVCHKDFLVAGMVLALRRPVTEEEVAAKTEEAMEWLGAIRGNRSQEGGVEWDDYCLFYARCCREVLRLLGEAE